jgi:hypothetical protein
MRVTMEAACMLQNDPLNAKFLDIYIKLSFFRYCSSYMNRFTYIIRIARPLKGLQRGMIHSMYLFFIKILRFWPRLFELSYIQDEEPMMPRIL